MLIIIIINIIYITLIFTASVLNIVVLTGFTKERKLSAVPAWKRQLLAQKSEEEKKRWARYNFHTQVQWRMGECENVAIGAKYQLHFKKEKVLQCFTDTDRSGCITREQKSDFSNQEILLSGEQYFVLF